MLFFANTQKAPGFESSSASSDNKTKQHTQHGAAYTHALPTSPVELPSGQVCLSVRAAPAQTWQATLTSTAATTLYDDEPPGSKCMFLPAYGAFWFLRVCVCQEHLNSRSSDAYRNTCMIRRTRSMCVLPHTDYFLF